jgi:hypothetical protein
MNGLVSPVPADQNQLAQSIWNESVRRKRRFESHTHVAAFVIEDDAAERTRSTSSLSHVTRLSLPFSQFENEQIEVSTNVARVYGLPR